MENNNSIIRVVATVCMITYLISIASASSPTATFYTRPYIPSACDGNKNEGVMIAAASDAIWDGGAACGRHYRVTCTGGRNAGSQQPCTGQSVVVKIVDYCPAGCAGTIDLSQEAFAIIADPNAGIVDIKYKKV